jgi:hypothetical protein
VQLDIFSQKPSVFYAPLRFYFTSIRFSSIACHAFAFGAGFAEGAEGVGATFGFLKAFAFFTSSPAAHSPKAQGARRRRRRC